MKYLLKKESWKTAPGLTNNRQKEACQKKASRIKKDSAYSNCGWHLQMEEVEDDDDNDEWQPVKPITSPCDSNSGYWGWSARKSV
jgi:hypothetical protein